jgi:uncharacterized protein YqgV (UPF0045/DUF77 family)
VASGMEHVLHGHGTNIIGELHDILALVEACQVKLQQEMGVQNCNFYLRIQSNLSKKDLSLASVMQSVKDKM